MIKRYLENYFEKIKATKKVSTDNGVNWLIPFFNSFLITVVLSFQLSQGVWYLLDSLQSGQIYQPWYMEHLWTLSSFSLTIFMTIITFTIQDKIILFFIKLNSYMNKLILQGISKLDMMLWRKYDKQNVVTNFIWKIQERYMSRSKKQRKMISFAFVICLGMYYTLSLIY